MFACGVGERGLNRGGDSRKQTTEAHDVCDRARLHTCWGSEGRRESGAASRCNLLRRFRAARFEDRLVTALFQCPLLQAWVLVCGRLAGVSARGDVKIL